MVRITKNTLLNYIPNKFTVESEINKKRIFEFQKTNFLNDGHVIYLCEREIRLKENFALQFAHKTAKDLNLPLKIIYPQRIFDYQPKQNFIDNQVKKVQADFKNFDMNFEIVNSNDFKIYLKNQKIAVLIIDFNPILNRDWLRELSCKIYEVDGHNIVPARFVSEKQEYNAATLRRKIYYQMFEFLTEYQTIYNIKTEADEVLEDFIQNKLPYYYDFKNNPAKNVLSDLSRYINLGFISSQKVALDVIRADTDDKNKESFLEELVIRKELADNFCLYCNDFKTFTCIPDWAKHSLEVHDNDIRTYLYSIDQLEKANTHDVLWNACQKQLMCEGKIHGYLRMYWAKKIQEWSENSQTALKNAIYLNDKYSYDSPSSSGYTGILWAIGGLHDRAFRNFSVTGKIRRMTKNSIEKKFNIYEYIEKYK